MERRYAVFTTFHDEGYKTYGKRFIETFDQYWHDRIVLIAFYEGKKPDLSVSNRIRFISLHDFCPKLVDFKNRHENDYQSKGLRKPNETHRHFEFDAYRFSNKSLCVTEATRKFKDEFDVMIWLDADVVTFAPIDHHFLDPLLPQGKYTSFLGRVGKYPECGFVMYDIHHPAHDEFMQAWEELYVKDTLFHLQEWHDSFVYNVLKNKFQLKNKFKSHDIAKDLIRGEGHPFINSVLGTKMDHLKGKRKATGKSWADDLLQNSNHTHDYWGSVTNNPYTKVPAARRHNKPTPRKPVRTQQQKLLKQQRKQAKKMKNSGIQDGELIKYKGTWFPANETHMTEMIDKSERKTGIADYQHRTRSKVYSIIDKGNTVVDIGAHVGTWSRSLVKKFDFVVAFEPVEVFRDCFVKNVVKSNYILEPYALGNERGKVRMKMEESNTGHTHVEPNTLRTHEGDIQMIRLDDYQWPKEVKKIDLIKIDVEGLEKKVLEGARDVINKHKPIIVLEQKNHTMYGGARYAALEYLKNQHKYVILGQEKDDYVMGPA